MIGNKQTCAQKILHRSKKPREIRGHVEVGTPVSELLVRLRQRAAAEPVRTATEVDQQQSRRAAIQTQLRRRHRAHVGNWRKRRNDQRHRRRDRVIPGRIAPLRVHRQTVLADRNRDAERGAQLQSNRLDRIEQRLIFVTTPRCGHPVRRQHDAPEILDGHARQIRQRFADRHSCRRRGVEQCKRRAFTHRHRFALQRFEAERRDGRIGYRHLPRTDPLIAHDEAGDAAIADRDQKLFRTDRGEPQHTIERIGEPDAV